MNMKKVMFLAVVAIIFLSCEIRKKSIYDLELVSLNSGIHIDTLFGKLRFGMTENKIYKELDIFKGSKYNFAIDELHYIDFIVQPHYLNDSLYSLGFLSYDQTYRYSDIIKNFTMKYDNPDTIIYDDHTSKTESTYWLKGNLELKIEKVEYDKTGWVEICYTDLSKKTFNSSYSKEDINDPASFYSEYYYNKVYLPSKKRDIKGKL